MPVKRLPNQLSGQRSRRLPLGLVIIADILLAGVGLMIFAFFHHVLPHDYQTAGQSLPRLTTTLLAAFTSHTTPSDQAIGTESISESTPSARSEEQTTAVTAAQTTAPAVTETASPAATAAGGMWGSKFADKFTSGAIEQTAASYRSANINIQIQKVQTGKVTYYVADIYLRDIRYFRTAFAGGQYARNVLDEVLDMAIANQAILAMSGDYFGIRDRGIVIRNGELYREKLYADVLVMNNDGSMQTFTAAEFDLNAVKSAGAWQAWSFGPMLLRNGQAMTSFNSEVTALNPRGAIGYYEPGHYCFVLVDGRQAGYSIGMTMTQLSQLFAQLGCQVAYNLDGGQSAVLTFQDSWVNQPYRGGRKISDIVYIAE